MRVNSRDQTIFRNVFQRPKLYIKVRLFVYYVFLFYSLAPNEGSLSSEWTICTPCLRLIKRPVERFSKAPETFRARKAIAKSRTLGLQSCFIHVFLIWTEIDFTEEVSGVYTSPFLHTDERKMALRARKLSGTFEKRARGPGCSKPD